MIYRHENVPIQTSNYFKTCWIKIDAESNITEQRSDTNFVYSNTESAIAGFLYGLESFFGAILNILVIIVLLRCAKLRKEYLSPCIISVAFNNYIYCMYPLLVQSLQFFIGDKPLPQILLGCQLYGFVTYSLWLCSAWTLLGVAILRCVKVYFPRESKRNFFRRICKLMSVLAWVISFTSLLPTFVGKYGQFGFRCKTFACSFIATNVDGSHTNLDPKIVYGITVVTLGILMIIANVATYLKLLKITNNILKEMTDVTSNEDPLEKSISKRKEKLEKERSFGRMIGTMTLTFLLVYVLMVVLFISVPNPSHLGSLACLLIAASIVILNPLVYIISQERYRVEIQKLLKSIYLLKLK